MVFTAEQKRIFRFVEHEIGHGIIDAVAGAGKTTTIMECAKFVKDKSAILFCAFNNSIANEISRKFHSLALNEVTTKTIHGLGRQILQDNNSSGQPIKLDENKYRELLKSINVQDELKPHFKTILKINGLEIEEFDNRQKFAVNNLVNRINSRLLEINQKYRSTLTKSNIIDFDRLVTHYGIFNEIEIGHKNFKEELVEYFECHKILLLAGNKFSRSTMIIDFTDMLYLPFEWSQHPIKKYEFLFIDECQDLSMSQFAIAAKYGKKDGRILAVGDPSQSIYGFTGADIDSFNKVKEFTRATELPLTTCFRCPKEVIEIARTIREDIIGNKEAKGLIMSIQFEDVIKVAKPGDLIISRLKAPIVLMVFSFIDRNIKVLIHEDEVREIINEIKTLFKQEELNVFISTLPTGFADLKKEVIIRWNWIIQKNAERIVDITERNLYISNERKYLESKLEFLHKKYEQWKDCCHNLTDILVRIKSFISATDNPIKLSTIHRAKGLENNRVFILNYDELPYYRVHQKSWERIQELNLKYVALTRTSNELYLIESKKTEVLKEEGSLFDNLPFV